ncbi:uncharacterized protein LOC142235524 [Haematobia irritans]|uniref:uncharacterized protein LOC142235524 n=1 Tax=Haematobia irritans TaxID=7368 RepID=UPI003F4FEC7B
MPIIDDFGLIRVGGRLEHSNQDFDARHPLILPKNHPIITAVVMHFHNKLLHAGTMKPRLMKHVMGDLPTDRVRPNKAFHTTDVDFCGPFYYKSEVKSRPPVKSYVCIFTCFATKATHLEFKTYRRLHFCTSAIYFSQGQANHVGAKNELNDLKQMFLRQCHLNAVHDQCLNDGIEWKFIPPRSPHFGGLWEAAVKSVKFHFYRAVGLNTLTFDELRTLVCQISAILNSRPLCPISEDPDDLDVLTPGGPLIFIPEPNMAWIDFGRLAKERSKWQTKGEEISPGCMVLVKDDNLPPLKWQIGRITEIIKGKDDVVRVVNVRTSC